MKCATKPTGELPLLVVGRMGWPSVALVTLLLLSVSWARNYRPGEIVQASWTSSLVRFIGTSMRGGHHNGGNLTLTQSIAHRNMDRTPSYPLPALRTRTFFSHTISLTIASQSGKYDFFLRKEHFNPTFRLCAVSHLLIYVLTWHSAFGFEKHKFITPYIAAAQDGGNLVRVDITLVSNGETHL